MSASRSLPRPAPGQLKWWVIGAVGITAGIALSIWFGLSATLGYPSFETTGYKIESDQLVTVKFDVRSPEGKPVRCTIEAMGRDFAILGSTEVDVPLTDTTVVSTSATVRTTSRAVTGNVTDCVHTP